ncbi:HDOD domain-containing protein [Massilia sp. PAMC28688]|uniref:HDOD domain-containing protein n=1 Tax=Massilia sp. PAMC28688 TaxID=2861283 RepID=UPI001C62AE0C|nr:HDOD domain-containing protein [Massilia sp. PAMC28688]QYF95572.1 HDOD domain-containing protein [Massilia sp. PAMC28688]
MPQILIKLIGHLQADDLGMTELAALIANDPGMTSKILAVANSSAYHRSSRSIGVEQALITLGTDMIKLLVIGESVAQTFHNFPHAGSLDLRRFWKHSITAALVARDLAQRMHYAQPEEAYLAGLLHNVGRLALLATAPRDYAYNFSARDDEGLCAVEQRTLQITHAEAGAWLIERWQLDSFLADAVLYHHEAGSRLAFSHPLIRIVRLAHVLASADAGDEEVADAAALCGLQAEATEPIRASAARQLILTAAQLGINLEGADDAVAPPAWAPVQRDPVQQRLAEDVGQQMLVAHAGQAFARQQGEAGLFDAITRAARILFDFSDAIVLVEDAGTRQLVGTGGSTQQRSAQFTAPLDGRGALALAAGGGKVQAVPGSAGGAGLAEQQMLRLLGSESMVCIPLVAGSRSLGVLAGGVQAWQAAQAGKRERFMQAFGVQAASAMEAALAGRGHTRRQLAHVADEYRAASRRVAHEVNNPLAIIKNYLGVLDEKLARQESVAGEVTILSEEIDRVGHLINGLAGLPDGAPGSVNTIGAVVDDVQRLFRAGGSVPAGVLLATAISPACEGVACDADMLKQVLVNLVKNALEAVGADGRIDIASRNHVHRDGRLFVELVVSDNGPGLPQHVMAGLFAPVRSDKDGPHRGLGLSIVHGLLTRAGGCISCRSGSAGTSFDLLLPAWTEPA